MFIESKRNEYCTQIVELLKKYYDSVGIYPERENNERYSFHCSNKEKCSGDNLARGMQCHIGYNYGETLKVVVSALDCGNGGADIIERRTHNVLTSHNNPHMRGTLKAVSLIIDKTPEDSINYMAMINACKCCHKNDTSHMPKKYYERCAIHKLAEYEMLKPDVILFQGKKDLSLAGCENNIHDIEDSDLDSDLKDYLKTYSDGKIECYAVICIHPSARGRSYAKKKIFYDEQFPRIAEYLKKKVNGITSNKSDYL